ncbi:unnamed protein product [Didymodactylos carnosus]|uniref:Uncharacterized protein n=1 Tax=Didymodactylos carnosus TaxID=1234261 RepID=A0A815C683_9BILA|nr:unnamed protein product [Didymodactylos carnosus]CAF4079965.1 unnamed protein product [Didymodactylos carnosus]
MGQAVQFNRKRRRFVTVKHNGYYIPLLRTIQMMFAMPNIRQAHTNQSVSPDNVMRDFIDGAFSKRHEFFKDPSKLKVVLYEDGIVVRNPLQKKSRVLSLFVV